MKIIQYISVFSILIGCNHSADSIITYASNEDKDRISQSNMEIYLLKNSFQENKHKPEFNYFFPSKGELCDSPFILDSEILAYDIKEDTIKNRKAYTFLLKESAAEKINNLKDIPLCCGLKFAVTVNSTPIFGAYFWNVYSSFGCNWIVSFARSEGKLKLMKALPSEFYDKEHEDPRGNNDLLEACRISNRLVNN